MTTTFRRGYFEYLDLVSVGRLLLVEQTNVVDESLETSCLIEFLIHSTQAIRFRMFSKSLVSTTAIAENKSMRRKEKKIRGHCDSLSEPKYRGLYSMDAVHG